MDDLDKAIDSTKTIAQAVQDNLSLLQEQCGRSFDNVVPVVKDMNDNLKVLRDNADMTLDLIKCKNINDLYVNTVHEAACTYSVSALAWIFASALIIAVCGLIMIMLRSAYYPTEVRDLSEAWIKSPSSSGSQTKESPTNSAATEGSVKAGAPRNNTTLPNNSEPATPIVTQNAPTEFAFDDFDVELTPEDEF